MTIIVFMVKSYFSDAIIPWYKSKMGRSYIVRGRWEANTNPEYAEGVESDESLYIQ
jgi:hypothetical protein